MRKSRSTKRRPEAEAYGHWYTTHRWRKFRVRIIQRDGGLCQECDRQGRVSAATVVHHKEAHKGDPALFWDEANVEAVCQPCHDGEMQQTERLGYSLRIGVDGWPVDGSHPANRGAAPRGAGSQVSPTSKRSRWAANRHHKP